jgi:uncharacterized iron-regulated membrane protein
MPLFSANAVRRFWLNIHLWLGIGLAILSVPISLSGALLVFHDDIDAVINPHRHAVSGPQIALPPSVYLTRAAAAVAADPSGLRPTALRLPDEPGGPVRVIARVRKAEPGTRPRIVTVFLDPPTGNILDVMEFRATLFGFLHVFHENLTIPRYSGRQIVGWAGVGLLTMSLTGLWLWWPRGGFLRGLRWSRSTQLMFNLHHLIGFWISLPLALVSLTGIYLAFPQTAHSLTSTVAPMNAQGPRGIGGPAATNTALSADAAVAIAKKHETGATIRSIALPGARSGDRGAPVWRVQMQKSDGWPVTVAIDDRSGGVVSAQPPKSGDRAAAWMRWIHQGSHSGWLWKTIVLLAGLAPSVFVVTGTTMWLRRRAMSRSAENAGTVQLRPAE